LLSDVLIQNQFLRQLKRLVLEMIVMVFVSCTNLRVASIIETAEARLGKPVTSSNHALAWHLLRLAGIQDCPENFGSLFQVQLN
jgi:maleate cis-trans isomerase